MQLQLSKWGNSLAVRLPMAALRAAGIQEGDRLEAEFTPTGITLTPQRKFDKKAFLERLRQLHKKMPMTTTTVEDMRKLARY